MIFRRIPQSTVFIDVHNGLWDNILEHLVKVTRKTEGLEEIPTVALIDSQSVKNAGASEQCGFDAGKKLKKQSAK